MSGGDECLDLGVAGAESVDKLSALVILHKLLEHRSLLLLYIFGDENIAHLIRDLCAVHLEEPQCSPRRQSLASV